jgi:hypothetical protein
MTWVSWRLQRTEILIGLGILALLAALLIPTGITMADAYHQYDLGTCRFGPNLGPVCANYIGLFQQRFQALITVSNFFTLIPGLIGVLLAAPFILELEHGTYRLAWTQSITRGRWLTGKLGLPILAALLASGTLILLLTWWRTPQVNLNGRLDAGSYDTEGTVVLGYTLFALGLALALGAVWRRAAASLTVAFVGYFAARIFVDAWLRQRLISPATVTWSGNQQPNSLYNATVLDQTIAGRAGHQIATSGSFLGGHVQVSAPGLNSHTIFHAVYIPTSDFWPLQLRETALFAGIALILILFAVWWTKDRTT